ncbi:MAG: hypothetical protein HWQ35_15875 [Nostoc sp. NMS1]|nr:hypothetical protein [Nostoc sp. NMS1]MBN3989453.1 hypothetical protein [Nostoc sp. NMS2]
MIWHTSNYTVIPAIYIFHLLKSYLVLFISSQL